MAKHGIITKTHSGTKNQFHQHFIKTELVSEDFEKLYDNLFSERNDTDYGYFQTYDRLEVESLLVETELQVYNLIEFIQTKTY